MNKNNSKIYESDIDYMNYINNNKNKINYLS